MKKHIALLTLVSTIFALTGCKTGTTPPSDATLTLIKSIAASVSSQALTFDLANNPGHRPAVVVTSAALSAMVASDTYTPALLASALSSLPALSGSDGALVELGSLIYSVAVGWIPIDTAPRLKAVVLGLDAGLKSALAIPASQMKQASVNLPPPCTVPNKPDSLKK